MRRSGTGLQVRAGVARSVIPWSRLTPFQHAFVQRLSGLGIEYRGSPIVEGTGERYFDDSLRGGAGIRSRFLLVLGDEAESSSSQAAQQLARSLSDLVELRLRPHHGITLVRPDGYIAYSAPDHDGIAAVDSVRSLLERQTNQEKR